MFQFFAIYLYFMKTFIFFISPYHIKDTCLLRTHFFFLLHKKRRIYSYAFYDSLVLWNIAIFIKTLYREVLDTHTHTHTHTHIIFARLTHRHKADHNNFAVSINPPWAKLDPNQKIFTIFLITRQLLGIFNP